MRKHCPLHIAVLAAVAILVSGPAQARQMNILVYPFENTGDQKFAWISAGMTDTVISDLGKIKEISVVSESDRKRALEEMKFSRSGMASEENMVAIGKMTGANIIFSGSYLVAGDRIRVNAKLMNVESGRVESTTKLDGVMDGIFDLQDRVVFSLLSETEKVQIAHIPQIRIADDEKKKIAGKQRTNKDAYELYAKGLQLMGTNPRGSLALFQQALEKDSRYIDALIQAGYVSGNTLNRFEESLAYLGRADRIFKERKDVNSSDYAKFNVTLGSIYNAKGQPDTALVYYEDARRLREQLHMQTTGEYANVLLSMGNAYLVKGQADEALRYFQECRDIRDKLGQQNTEQYALVLMNIGVAYDKKNDNDQALRYYLDSQAIRDQLGRKNTSQYALLLMNIGVIHRRQGRTDEALRFYEDSRSLRDTLGLQQTGPYANLLANMGVAYTGKGDTDRALGVYREAQAIRDALKLQNTADYANLMYNMGVAMEKKKDRDAAGRYYRQAYDIYVQVGFSGPLKEQARKNAVRLGY